MANEKKKKTDFEIICEKLDKIIFLIQQSVAIKLYLGNATQDEITSNLHIRKATINKMVQGIKKINKEEKT